MATLIRIPQIAVNVDEATVGEWFHREGDSVRATDALVEIITSKATFELEAPAEGLLHIAAPERSIVPIGYIIGAIVDPNEAPPDVTEENTRLMKAFREKAAHRPAELKSAVKATPGARRLAKEMGVAVESIKPAKGDVVREEDVRDFMNGRGNR